MPELHGYDERHLDTVHELRSEASGQTFELTVSGAEFATTALILVHGFGVRRDSRGLFTAIADATKDDALTLRAGFSNVEGDDTATTQPFSEQVARLQAVQAFCRRQINADREVYVGHSQGWIPIALSEPTQKEIFALAPPMGNAFEAFIQTPGWSQRGSALNLDGDSHLTRSDGTLTRVPKEYWDEFRALGNVDDLMKRLAENNSTSIYFAGRDNVLGQQTAPRGVDVTVFSHANHDFTGESRDELIHTLLTDLDMQSEL